MVVIRCPGRPRSCLLQVAEATGRKKMRAKKAMEKAKAKANSIAESDEMGMKAKQRSIEKLCVAAAAAAMCDM